MELRLLQFKAALIGLFVFTLLHEPLSGQEVPCGDPAQLSWNRAIDLGGNMFNGQLNNVREAGQGVFIAVGEQGVILRSTDQGETWNSVETSFNTDLWGVHFIDDMLG